MALLFMDGCDHYNTADIVKKWSSATASMTIGVGGGRRGTNSLRVGNFQQWVAITLPPQPTWICGFAIRVTARPGAAVSVLQFIDGVQPQVDLRVNPNGTLSVTRSGTVLGTTTYVLPLSAYSYLEMKATIHASAGAVTVQADGVAVLTLTNVNTQVTGNAEAQQVRLGNNSADAMGTHDMDDLYVCDGTGPAPHNTLLGECRVDGMLPSGDTGTLTWTPSTGTAHWDLVNDPMPNVTDYISSSTPGQDDVFQMQNVLPVVPSLIYGMQLSAAALKTDAGARSISLLIVSNAVPGVTPPLALSMGQTYVRSILLVDPNTNQPWTQLAVNSALCGVRCA